MSRQSWLCEVSHPLSSESCLPGKGVCAQPHQKQALMEPIPAHIHTALRNACCGTRALVQLLQLPTCSISEIAWQPLKEESMNFYLPFTRLSL